MKKLSNANRELVGKEKENAAAYFKNTRVSASDRHVFIIGSRGIPAAYGGFETFVDKLTEYHKDKRIFYHVARMAQDNIRFVYHEADVFNVNVPQIGPARAVLYDLLALRRCLRFCKDRPDIKHPVFYVLACRIGPFIGYFKRRIEKRGGCLLVNPDGHEWKRSKWIAPIRKYWKLSEGMMVSAADMIVCDSKQIEAYIHQEYPKCSSRTCFIAYGSDIRRSALEDTDAEYIEWLAQRGLERNGYYLVVGRFVPENNYETMLKGFMLSKTRRKLVIIANENEKLRIELSRKTSYQKDQRIVFAGTVYEQELLKKIRENAFAYLHGHEVGGTNPSLLEAMGSTELNLLLGVGFNREVGLDAAFYWEKDPRDLAMLIDSVDQMEETERLDYGKRAKDRIRTAYSWPDITEKYEKLFMEESSETQ